MLYEEAAFRLTGSVSPLEEKTGVCSGAGMILPESLPEPCNMSAMFGLAALASRFAAALEGRNGEMALRTAG